MNLYHITRTEPQHGEYDIWDELLVCAESEGEAINILPSYMYCRNDQERERQWPLKPSDKIAKLIGTAAPGIEKGIIMQDFHYA